MGEMRFQNGSVIETQDGAQSDAFGGILPPRTTIGEIKTFTGRRFNPLDPDPAQVCCEDIAHALSQACRFGGHTTRFYSVAQHALYCSFLVPEPFALEALMHDASEAYLVDMPTPIKQHPGFEFYRDANDRLEAVIAAVYDLPHPMSPEVKQADRLMLYTEMRDLRNGSWDMEPHFAPFPVRPLTPENAKRMFLWRFDDLTGQKRHPGDAKLTLATVQAFGRGY